MTLWREAGCHAHLLHLDGRGKLDDKTLPALLVLLRSLAVGYFNALACQTLLMSRGCHSLSDHLLHIVLITIEAILGWHHYPVLYGIIMRYACAVPLYGS